MKLPIILIGPIGVGKSTIASILAKKLSVRHFPLDYLEGYYGVKMGMDIEKEHELVTGDDFQAYVEYKRPFELYAVDEVVKELEFKKGIIHFGAGHSYYPEDSMLNTAKAALQDVPNVILLLPSENLNKSSEVLRERLIKREEKEKTSRKKLESMLLVNQEFLTHKSNFELAKLTVYTEGKTPEMVADEIIKKSHNDS